MDEHQQTSKKEANDLIREGIEALKSQVIEDIEDNMFYTAKRDIERILSLARSIDLTTEMKQP